MAELFVASTDEAAGRTVVLKRMHPHLCDRPDFHKMFLREARIATSMEHPNIVRVTDMGAQGDELYLVMEHLQGVELGAVLRTFRKHGRQIGAHRAMIIAAQAARGLAYAHDYEDETGTRMGIVHRDVSPSNLFITHKGRVKVLDFGIAKATNSTQVTVAGERKGKGAYMAPEQVAGGAVDQRTDVYALGLVLYELSTMHRAYDGDNELAILHAISTRDPQPPSARVLNYPATLETVLLKALARDVDQRFANAGDLRTALEELITPEGLARSATDLAGLLDEVAALEATATPSVPGAELTPPPPEFGSGPTLSRPRFGTTAPPDNGALLLPTPTTMDGLLGDDDDDDDDASDERMETVVSVSEPPTQTTVAADRPAPTIAGQPAVALTQVSAPPTRVTAAPAPAPRGRASGWAWALLGAAVLAAGYSAWTLLGSRDGSDAATTPEPSASALVADPAPPASNDAPPPSAASQGAEPLDPSVLLRSLNDEQTATAMTFKERHEAIRQLTAMGSGERVDIGLQLFLDAKQAEQSETPCSTYRGAMASLRTGDDSWFARAKKETTPPKTPGKTESAEACSAPLAPPPEAAVEAEPEPAGSRSRSKTRKPKAKPKAKPAPEPYLPVPKPKAQPPRATPPEKKGVGGKLDDELRPMG